MPQVSAEADLQRGYWAKLSQAVQRTPWGQPGTLTCKAVWYIFERVQTFDGVYSIRLQGLPQKISTVGLSDRCLRDLAGDGFPCPAISMFTGAIYFLADAPWCRPRLAPSLNIDVGRKSVCLCGSFHMSERASALIASHSGSQLHPTVAWLVNPRCLGDKWGQPRK